MNGRFVLVIIQVLVPFLLIVLLLISYWKRRWFLREPGYQNSYKTVYGIFKFAKSHKYLSDTVPSLTVITIFHLGWTLPRRDLEVLSLQSRWKM